MVIFGGEFEDDESILRGLHPVVIYGYTNTHSAGFLKGEWVLPGIEITSGHNSLPVTPPGKSMLTPAHYLSSAVIGNDAPLKVPGRSATIHGESGLLVTIPACEQWPVDAQVLYSLQPDDCIDAGFRFRFHQPVRNFEIHILSHVRSENSLSYVHIEDRWFRPALRDDQICFFARDVHAGETVSDGRWDFLAPDGMQVILDERGYDYPILVQQDTDGWAVVHMFMIDECPSICLYGAPRQHGFSCGGGSAEPGDQMIFHARLLYRCFQKLDDIIPFYHQFIRDVRQDEFRLP